MPPLQRSKPIETNKPHPTHRPASASTSRDTHARTQFRPPPSLPPHPRIPSAGRPDEPSTDPFQPPQGTPDPYRASPGTQTAPNPGVSTATIPSTQRSLSVMETETTLRALRAAVAPDVVARCAKLGGGPDSVMAIGTAAQWHIQWMQRDWARIQRLMREEVFEPARFEFLREDFEGLGIRDDGGEVFRELSAEQRRRVEMIHASYGE